MNDLGDEPANPPKWGFQEVILDLRVWAFGCRTHLSGGWAMDEREVFLGPLTFVFLR